MKILFINGENRENGLISQAQNICQKICEENGIELVSVEIDENRNHPCTACGKCIRQRHCIFEGINDLLEQADTFDGLIVCGSVWYGRVNGETVSFMERLMRSGNERFACRVGTVPLSTRKSRAEAAYGELNHFFAYADMIVVTDQSFGTLKGNEDGELSSTDIESVDRIVENMIWMMKAIDSKKAEADLPSADRVVKLIDFMR